MKILFVHDRLGAMAGAEVNLFATAEEMKRRGHTVGLIHGPGTGRNEDAWRSVFTSHFSLSGANRTCAVESALHVFRPDLVYMHNMADLEVLGALVASRLPIVRMVHDHDLYCMRSYKYNTVTRNVCTRPLSLYCLFPCGAFVSRNHAEGLPVRWNSYSAKKRELQLNQSFQRHLVASWYMRDELIRNEFDAEKIEIHPPVPRVGEMPPVSTFSDRNLLLYAGQIVRGKGVDVLLQSLALVDEPFECIILGDGNHRAYCERLCRELNLHDRVQFRGYVSQEEVSNYYHECSVAVLSSVWAEPFGAVGLEAMRHGLPVVAFNSGGISEWLIDGYNGSLVPWMDRPSFATAITDLLRNKAMARQLGSQGLKLINEKYSFPTYITALEHVFSTVLAEYRCASNTK